MGSCHSSVNNIVRRDKTEGIEAFGGIRYMSPEQEEASLTPFVEQAAVGKIIEITNIYTAYREAIGHSATRNAIYYLRKSTAGERLCRGRHPKNKRGSHCSL